jgi:alkyl sulfatase BDS1-like metallo-beta-lactamase superfamily hydrolase
VVASREAWSCRQRSRLIGRAARGYDQCREHLSASASQLTPEQIFDSLAIRINGPRACNLDLLVDITLADLDTNYRLALRNGVLVSRKATADATTANVTIKLDNMFRLLKVTMGDVSSLGLDISGDQAALQQLLRVLDKPDPAFNIVTP